MSAFDAKAARAKRPLPLWVDALVRDTALLETDELGAYLRILMAMWVSRAVALPNDPKKLARAAGVSLRLWNSRIGPALAGFWTTCPEGITQKRLREEAAYTERQVTQQSARKRSENSDKHLETHDQEATADDTVDAPAVQPTQQPNIYGGGGSAHAREADIGNPITPRTEAATAREAVLAAMGLDASGVTGPTGKIVGNMADMAEYRRWRDDLGLDHSAIIAVIRETMAAKRDGPPSTFTYFTQPMRRAAAALAPKPMLTPIDGGRRDDDRDTHQPARPSRDPHARALGGMVEAFGHVIAAQSAGRGGPDDGM